MTHPFSRHLRNQATGRGSFDRPPNSDKMVAMADALDLLRELFVADLLPMDHHDEAHDIFRRLDP